MQLTKEVAAKRIASVLRPQLDKTGLLIIVKHLKGGNIREEIETNFVYDGIRVSTLRSQEITFGVVQAHKNGLCGLSGNMYVDIALTDGYLPDPCAGAPQEDGTLADKYCLVQGVSPGALLNAGGFPFGSTDAIVQVADPWDKEVKPRRVVGEDARDICPYQKPTYVSYVDITKGWLNAGIYHNPEHIDFCLPVNEFTRFQLPPDVEELTGQFIAQVA